ncbi:amino acid permease [Actinomycetes bacterium KLBMP 9759]
MRVTVRDVGTTTRNDEALLHRLGYAQRLDREFGGFSNFAISFTIISALASSLTSYYMAFHYGGPIAITWGWLLVGVFCVLIAMAMGEIASTMPTAGALYYWAAKLGGPAWGWFTGWFNLIGMIAATAAGAYGAGTFLTALLHLWFPTLVGTDSTTIFVTFTALMLCYLGLNMFNVNLLAKLNTVSAWWHLAATMIIVVVLTVVPRERQSVSFVFTETINNSGFDGDGIAFWFVFGLGLLMAQYTFTGYDASAHLSEETRSAARMTPWGLVMSVAVSVVYGFVLLVAITFAVPDVQGTLDAGANAVVYIWQTSMNEAWAEFLLLLVVIAQIFWGIASVTSGSRMLFAFSRDGTVPGSRVLRKVSDNRVPVNAVIAESTAAWALMIPTLANGAIGYLVGSSIAVIGLYIAIAMPLILRIRMGSRFEPGVWSLGRHYKWITPLSVAWIVVMCVLFLMPVNPKGVPGAPDFDWSVVNYAPLTVAGALVLFGGWYLLSARHWFKGPVREVDAEIASIERNAPAVPVRSGLPF